MAVGYTAARPATYGAHRISTAKKVSSEEGECCWGYYRTFWMRLRMLPSSLLTK